MRFHKYLARIVCAALAVTLTGCRFVGLDIANPALDRVPGDVSVTPTTASDDPWNTIIAGVGGDVALLIVGVIRKKVKRGK